MILIIDSLLSLFLPIILLFLFQQQSHSFAFTSIKSQQSSGLVAGRIRALQQNDRMTTNCGGGGGGGGGFFFCGATRKEFFHHDHQYTTTTRRCVNSILYMRDMSSANVFQIGDRVKVVSSVYKAGIDLKGRIGTVQETWEKCDVDPTCCCAEFVDENFAVTVKFDRCLGDTTTTTTAAGGDNDNKNTIPIVGLNDYFTHFFSEEELIHAKVEENKFDDAKDEDIKEEEEEEVKSNNQKDDDDGDGNDNGNIDDAQGVVAFDGMSCKAFKLEQLKMGEQAKRIAAYESSLEITEKGNDIDS